VLTADLGRGKAGVALGQNSGDFFFAKTRTFYVLLPVLSRLYTRLVRKVKGLQFSVATSIWLRFILSL
jgi:hypothetical protein